MSDGERTVLYMAARVLTADQPIILIDEPEIHMHSRLAVQFWDEAEKLRPDCRFVYITHRPQLHPSEAEHDRPPGQNQRGGRNHPCGPIARIGRRRVLGAATLPFYAKRIFLFEGGPGKGFASEFFNAWFDDLETFSIPSGDRNTVIAAVTGLRTVGVVAAEVIGLIDRDFYSDGALAAVPRV